MPRFPCLAQPANRRQFLGSSLSAAAGLLLARPAAGQKKDRPPITGLEDPRLAPFDELMTSFIGDYKLPGAALAVARHGRLVYARGFGYADLDGKKSVQPASLFRIASVSKPLTAVAVLRLVDRGKLGLEDKALDLIKVTPHLAPGAKPDPRLGRITIRNLLQHTGGWDRDVSFDPIAVPWRVARELGIEPPVRPVDVVRYALGLPLDFDPGARHAYSNVGYLVLGRIIEALSRQSYEAFVRREVLAPLGLSAPRLGKGAIEGRAPGEVHYYDSKKRTGPAVVGPHVGKTVPLPDGADNVDGYEAHGGWIASAIDLVRFAAAFDDPARCRLLKEETVHAMWARPEGLAGHSKTGKPLTTYYGCGWSVHTIGKKGKLNAWHSGLIAGTSSLLVRRNDGLTWAVLFNTDADPDGKHRADRIDPLLHEAADRVKSWPDKDLFARYLKP
jgi:N-acyl-D-amino-acid deacylase